MMKKSVLFTLISMFLFLGLTPTSSSASKTRPPSYEKIRATAKQRRKELEKYLKSDKISDLESQFNSETSLDLGNVPGIARRRWNELDYDIYMVAAVLGKMDKLKIPDDELALNFKNKRGETLLHLLAERGDEKWIRKLRRQFKDLDVTVKDKDGKTPAQWARERGFFKAAALLEQPNVTP